MAGKTLQEIAKAMKSIDYAMLFTKSDGGELAGRPMSNNNDVDYDGDSWFFSHGDTRTVADIEADAKVALSFAGKPGLLGKPGLFVAVEGRGELIRDRATMEEHWTSDVERYFPDGLDTPGIVLIHVHANRIHYWDGEEEGEITPA